MVAWRLGQLYAVMPKRGTESASWVHLGSQLWPSTANGVGIEEQLGGVHALTGSHTSTRPLVASVVLGRVFPSDPIRE